MFRTPKLYSLVVCVVCILCAGQITSQILPTSTAPQKFRSNCDDPPVLFCPDDFSACIGASTLPSNTGYAVTEPGGILCDQPLLSFTDSTISTGPCPGAMVIERTWTARDPYKTNLVTTCVQVIQIGDDSPPVFFNCPKDTTIQPNFGCMASYSWTPPLVTDDCGRLTLDVTHINGDKFPLGETTVTYKAVDACGNTETCSFIVNVKGECCDLPPKIICPPDYFGCPGDSIQPKKIGKARAMPGRPHCPQPEVTWFDDTVGMANCPNGIIVERTWTARDPHNKSLKATCVQTITLDDDRPPFIFACPQDIIVESNEYCEAVVDWIEPRAIDNCDSVIITRSHAPGDTFQLDTTIVTYTATDLCGNSTTCTFVVVVIDKCCNEPPIIDCPADYTGCPDSTIDPATTGTPTVAPGGPDCQTPLVTYTDSVLSEGPCQGEKVILRLWIARDSVDTTLTASCTQTIQLFDTISPVFVKCPQDTTVKPNVDCEAIVNWDEPIVMDNCGLMSVTSNYAPGDTFPIGQTIVTYTATDSCGNVDSCMFTITVLDDCCNQPPIITCPDDYIGCLKTSTDTSLTGLPVVDKYHPSCGPVILTFTDDTVATGPCNGQFLIERTWKAQDSIYPNLVAFCTQVISLEDEDNPFFWECPNDTIIDIHTNCKAVVEWIPPVAMDSCGLVSVTSTHEPGDTFDIGKTTVIYTAVDACGNDTTCSFTITVNGICCDLPPVIECPEDFLGCVGLKADLKVTGTAVAMPGKPGCENPVVSFTDDTLSVEACGKLSIARTWKAIDPNDTTLMATCVQSIIFDDNEAPFLLDCPGDTMVSPNNMCQAIVKWTPPTAIDSCTAVTITSTHQPGDTFDLGTTVVTYTATDQCGNASTCSFEVVVKDECCTEPPIISCPPDFIDCPGVGTDTSITGVATALPSSPFCEDPIVTYTDFVISQGPCPGTIRINRIWVATDPEDSTLRSTCLQIIVLEDTLAPAVNDCPGDTTLSPNFDCEAIVSWDEPVFTDNCMIVEITASHEPGDTFQIGTTTVTYTATDTCGMVTTCSFMIEVLDDCCNKPPVITCPADLNACPGVSLDPAFTGFATAQKGHPSCDEPLITFVDDTISLGPCSGALVVERTWTAEDPNDRSFRDSCVQRFTLEDLTAPQFVNCPGDTTISANDECQVVVAWTEPTAQDNCSQVTITSSHQPGDTFNIGTTTVTYIAVDACGNMQVCAFDVIIDGEEFAIVCPGDTTIGQPTHPDGEYVYWTKPAVNLCGEPCPDSIPDYVYMGELDGHRYFCSLYSATWEDAKEDCEQVGGQLAIINSERENDYVASKLMGQNAYIGLSDRDAEGTFKWVNGDGLTFENWAPGQPDNLNNLQDFVEMAPTGLWSDQYAYVRNEFVCEIPCYDLEQIEGPDNGGFFPCGNTTVTYAAEDKFGNTDTCSFDVTVDCSGSLTYCNALGLNSSENWIQSVTIADGLYVSGDNNGYGDFTASCIDVVSPSSEDICLEIGYTGAPRNVFWRVWIDYNKDLDFNDRGETAYEGYGKSFTCGTLNFPDELNVRTRMRVAISHGQWPTSCGYVPSGEYEDYCIVIEDGTLHLKEENGGRTNAKPETESILLREVKLFPNPVHDLLNVTFGGEKPVSFEIYNMLGQRKLAKAWDVEEDILSLDIRDWRSGQFIIKLTYMDGQESIKNFIIADR